MNDNTELLRQINPDWSKNNKISSVAFYPMGDKTEISTYDGDMISPEDAFLHFVKKLKLDSAGVVSIYRKEFTDMGTIIIEDRIPFKEHIGVSFRNITPKNRFKKIGKTLSTIANSRGWAYRPDDLS